MPLTFHNFSQANRIRCESPHGFNHAINSWSESDWMTALIGEAGEAANLIKKLNRVRDGIPGNGDVSQSDLTAGLADEIADTFIYLDLLAQRLGFDLETIVRDKFNRTSQKIGSTIQV
jgi:NTP pyrophosphatase (non-canonical NTP hydrolase)